jgi:hypothetical protein
MCVRGEGGESRQNHQPELVEFAAGSGYSAFFTEG